MSAGLDVKSKQIVQTSALPTTITEGMLETLLLARVFPFK
jgi:hypothetical protein